MELNLTNIDGTIKLLSAILTFVLTVRLLLTGVVGRTVTAILFIIIAYGLHLTFDAIQIFWGISPYLEDAVKLLTLCIDAGAFVNAAIVVGVMFAAPPQHTERTINTVVMLLEGQAGHLRTSTTLANEFATLAQTILVRSHVAEQDAEKYKNQASALRDALLESERIRLELFQKLTQS